MKEIRQTIFTNEEWQNLLEKALHDYYGISYGISGVVKVAHRFYEDGMTLKEVIVESEVVK